MPTLTGALNPPRVPTHIPERELPDPVSALHIRPLSLTDGVERAVVGVVPHEETLVVVPANTVPEHEFPPSCSKYDQVQLVRPQPASWTHMRYQRPPYRCTQRQRPHISLHLLIAP